jgi:hypothetical protein
VSVRLVSTSLSDGVRSSGDSGCGRVPEEWNAERSAVQEFAVWRSSD